MEKKLVIFCYKRWLGRPNSKNKNNL